jgi:hypothetical protein
MGLSYKIAITDASTFHTFFVRLQPLPIRFIPYQYLWYLSPSSMILLTLNNLGEGNVNQSRNPMN